MEKWMLLKTVLKFILVLVIFMAISLTIQENWDYDIEIVIFTVLAIVSAYLLGLFQRPREKK